MNIPREFSADPRLNLFFATLQDVCAGWPNGLGLYCTANGVKAIRHPPGILFFGESSSIWPLVAFCQQHCDCVDIPQNSVAVSNQNQVNALGLVTNHMDDAGSVQGGSNDDDDVSISSGAMSTYSDIDNFEYYLTQCNRLYGRPTFRDCQLALNQYIVEPPRPRDPDQHFWFYNPVGVDAETPNIQVPKTYHSGDCYVRIQSPDDETYEEELRRYEVSNPIKSVMNRCVRSGWGGQAHITYYDSDYEDDNPHTADGELYNLDHSID